MARKYPTGTCRDCRLADWVWSNKPYPEGRRRIIVQRPGHCKSDLQTAAAKIAGVQCLEAQRPFTDCPAWQPIAGDPGMS